MRLWGNLIIFKLTYAFAFVFEKMHCILWKLRYLCKLWKLPRRSQDLNRRAVDRGGKVFHLPARLSLTVPCCFLFRPLRPLSRNAVRCSHAPPSTAPAPSTAPPATTAPPASVLCPTRTAPPPPSRPSACPRRRRHVRAPPASTRPAPPPSSHSPWSCRLPCSVTAVSAVDSVVK